MTTVQHVFEPSWSVRARIHGLRTIEQIQDEPMLFSAGLAFTEKVCLEAGGGSTTWWLVRFLMDHVLPKPLDADLNVVIDTRTHMLMKGMVRSTRNPCSTVTTRVSGTSRRRTFFRLSVTREPVRDQIRKQTQVYTTANTGW
jgi:hypothetical protein